MYQGLSKIIKLSFLSPQASTTSKRGVLFATRGSSAVCLCFPRSLFFLVRHGVVYSRLSHQQIVGLLNKGSSFVSIVLWAYRVFLLYYSGRTQPSLPFSSCFLFMWFRIRFDFHDPWQIKIFSFRMVWLLLLDWAFFIFCFYLKFY